MKKSLVRSAALAVGVLGLTASVVGQATPAGAVLPSGQVAVTAGGSDTTEVMMRDILQDLDNKSLTINGTATTVRTYNLPAFSSTPYATQGDADCTDVSWTKDPLAPGSNTAATKGVSPFGSGAGRNYLAAENLGTGPGSASGTDFGCIDVARSSGAPRAAGGGDKASFEFYAFAFDAVSMASTSLKAPSTLTRQQITDIYDCNVTNWDQVGGTSGPIQRYIPQPGSGTRSFFISDILVGKASSYTPPTGVAGCPNAVQMEENQAKVGLVASDRDKAIFPYSAAVWAFHAQNEINPTIDKRNGARLLGITTNPTSGTPVKASPIFWNGIDGQYQLDTSGVINENNVKQASGLAEATGLYPGVRFVYNVLDSNGNRKGYQGAFKLLGFSNVNSGFKSPLCDATAAGTGANEFAIILSNGFAPLPATANGTSNIAGSTCRFYAGVN